MTPRTIVLLRLAHADRIDWPALAVAFGQQTSLARVVPPPANVAYRPPSDPLPERSADLYDAVLTREGRGPLPGDPRRCRHAPRLCGRKSHAVRSRHAARSGFGDHADGAADVPRRLA